MSDYIMYNPYHPGIFIKEDYIDELGLTITETAKALGISRKCLSEIINGHTGISPEMAVRLSKAFDTSVESWLDMQKMYDLWQVHLKKDEILKDVKQLYKSDRRAVDMPSEKASENV